VQRLRLAIDEDIFRARLLKREPRFPKLCAVPDSADFSSGARENVARNLFVRRLLPGILRRIVSESLGRATLAHRMIGVLEIELPALYRLKAALVDGRGS